MFCYHTLLSLTVVALTASVVLADVKITLKNNCDQDLWPGFAGQPKIPENGGMILPKGTTKVITVPNGWSSARIWVRTKCNDKMECATGQCIPALQCAGTTGATPTSLAEFTLAKNKGDQDFYDVSYVDGYDINTTITPDEGTFAPANQTTGAGSNYCKSVGHCTPDLLKLDLPDNMKQKDSSGQVVAIKSQCTATPSDDVCCRGAFGSATQCKPANWSAPHAEIYKKEKAACPDAYMFPFDDGTSTFVCKGKGNVSPNGNPSPNDNLSPDYTITYC